MKDLLKGSHTLYVCSDTIEVNFTYSADVTEDALGNGYLMNVPEVDTLHFYAVDGTELKSTTAKALALKEFVAAEATYYAKCGY